MENLIQSRFDQPYASSKKFTMNAEVSFYKNKFEGK
jgi:hypothetical protein